MVIFWFLVISSGYPEFQLTQDQVSHVDIVLVHAIASGFGLGGLVE